MPLLKLFSILAIAALLAACGGSDLANYTEVELELVGLDGQVAIQVEGAEPKVIERDRNSITKAHLVTRRTDLTEESIQVTSQPEDQICMIKSDTTDFSQNPARVTLDCVAFSEIAEGVSEVTLGVLSSCVIVDDRLYCLGTAYNSPDWQDGAEYANPRLLTTGGTLRNSHCLVDDHGLHCHTVTSGFFDKEALWEQLDDVSEMALTRSGTSICFIDNNGLSCESPVRSGLAALLDREPRELTDPHSLTVYEYSLCVVDEGKSVCWGNDINVPMEELSDIESIQIGRGGGCAESSNSLQCWGYMDEVPEDLGAVREYAVADNHACALTDNGTQCWGYDVREVDAINTFSDPDSLVLSDTMGCVFQGERLSCFGRNYVWDLLPVGAEG